MHKFVALAGALAYTAISVQAQAVSPIYGQCGGKEWTGPTACAAGSTCIANGEYYSQCIPGSNTPPTGTSSSPSSTISSTVPSATSAPVGDSPYVGYQIFLSPYYAAEVKAAAAAINDSSLAARALKVAQIPTFTWIDVAAKVPTIREYLAQASALGKATGTKQLVQIVVYDLPDRDCAAKASNGEYSIANGGEALYRAYIDSIVAVVKAHPDVRVVAVVEPDSLANLITNLSMPKCQNAASAYRTLTVYALKQLSTVGVYMYMDAGHAGWLGWPNNLTPAAQLFAQIYRDAGSSPFIRGLATNVANYNAISAASPDPITKDNANYDEIHYINALAPALRTAGFPAQFIIDTGRSGVQNIRTAWGNWCNIKGAGFGIRPTLSTPAPTIDAIVWVKPGGEGDGTSNSSSTRFDSTCSLPDAHQPAPEAGTWFQAYFEALVRNANPAL